LLKTENGQYQLLRVGPAPGQGTAITQNNANFRVQSVPAVATVSIKFYICHIFYTCLFISLETIYDSNKNIFLNNIKLLIFLLTVFILFFGQSS